MRRKSLPTTHPRTPLRIFIFFGFSGLDFRDFRVLTWRPRLRFSRIPPGSLSGLPDRKCFTMPGSQPVRQPASQAVSSQPARQAASQLTIYKSLKQPVSYPAKTASHRPARRPASQPASGQSDRQPARQLFRESHSGAC